MKPELDFNSSGLQVLVPDNIKVKKVVRLSPLPLELGASLVYNLESHGVKWKVNCKETLFGGKVTADVRGRALEYRKRFCLPLVRLNCLVLGLRAALEPGTHRVLTSCRVGFELRQGTAEITKVNTVRVKPQLFFKSIGIEAVTDISVQIPKHLFFELPNDLGRGLPSWGRGARRDAHPASPRALPLPLPLAPSDISLGVNGRTISAGGEAGGAGGDGDAWGVSMEMQEINLIIKL